MTGKGRRFRACPFGRQTAQGLDRYIRSRERQALAPSRGSGSAGTGLTESGVAQMLCRRCAKAGIEPIHRHPFPAGMLPPTWVLVPAEIEAWLTDVNRLRPRSGAFAEARARLHVRFEQIHPFLDGNGRAGRLLLNLVLVRLGHPPAIIYKRQRAEYLRALRRADDGDYGVLGKPPVRAVLDHLYEFVVPAVAGPVRLVPLAALATTDISASALRVAAGRGRLHATRGADGEWRSSRAWVDEYARSRYRRSRSG